MPFPVQLVAGGNKLVLEQVVTTLASVADTAQDKFVAFYDRCIFSFIVLLALISFKS